MSSASNATELGYVLHARLCAGDDLTVTSELAERFLPALIHSLRARFFKVRDHDLFTHAATDALLRYFNHPTSYEPELSPLLPWLKKCARNQLLSELKRQQLHNAREEAVELADLESVYQQEPVAETALLTRSTDETVWRQLRAILDDPRDWQLAALMLDGVRQTEAFAAVLQVTEKPDAEQQQLVKRHKDRIKKAIQRHYRA